MERQKFEEAFKGAFDRAEVAPSNSVWTNVELDLEKASGDKMKRRLLFFQLLAAASMVFAMGVGSVYYLNGTSQNDPALAQNQERISTPQRAVDANKVDANKKEISAATETQPLASANQKQENNNGSNNKNGTNTQSQQLTVAHAQNIPVQNNNGQAENNSVIANSAIADNGFESGWRTRALPNLVEVKQPEIIVAKNTEPDPGMLLLARLKDQERKYQAEKKTTKEKLWTSLGVGAGSFNPHTTSTAPVATGLNGSAVPSASNPSSGLSYSVGVSVAAKISDRIVLQGGISYLSNNAEFTSSTATSERHASLNEFVKNSGDMVAISPYKVNSNLQYMSIPVQAGYILVDRKFALQLNGGISTDVFFQSTLTPENRALEKTTQSAGSDSPYRTLNFSGLLGTEISYKIGDHYRIAVNPGLRYALNSIYKTEVSTDISPMTFDVALRFRYIFK